MRVILCTQSVARAIWLVIIQTKWVLPSCEDDVCGGGATAKFRSGAEFHRGSFRWIDGGMGPCASCLPTSSH